MRLDQQLRGLRSRAGHGQDLLLTLGEMATYLPEAPKRGDEPKAHVRTVATDAPLESGSKVVMIGLKPIVPAHALITLEVWRSLFRQCQEG